MLVHLAVMMSVVMEKLIRKSQRQKQRICKKLQISKHRGIHWIPSTNFSEQNCIIQKPTGQMSAVDMQKKLARERHISPFSWLGKVKLNV